MDIEHGRCGYHIGQAADLDGRRVTVHTRSDGVYFDGVWRHNPIRPQDPVIADSLIGGQAGPHGQIRRDWRVFLPAVTRIEVLD